MGVNWSEEGWFVPVDYCALEHRVRPKDHIGIIRPFLPAKYSPLQTNGDGLQSVYLAELPEPLAQALIGLIGQAYLDAYATIADYQTVSHSSEPDQNIIERGIVGPTFRESSCEVAAWSRCLQGECSAPGVVVPGHSGGRFQASQGQPHQAVA